MRKFALLVVVALAPYLGLAQKTTKNNHVGNWSTNSSWTDNIAPAYTNVPTTNVDYDIYGYKSVGSFGPPSEDMTFQANKDAYDFTVYDTLVVFGNMTFANKAMNLVIPAGGVLIVLGNLSSTNKIDLSNGGILIVTGTATFGGSQSDYNGTGEFWPIGGIEGNNADPDAQTASNNSGNFFSNAAQSLINFVNSAGQYALPIELLYFNAELQDESVLVKWATEKEESFDHFELQRAGSDLEFVSITNIPGAGYNTNSLKEYSTIDSAPQVGTGYYRLKAVDIDGSVEYFQAKSVTYNGGRNFYVSPNPASGSSIKYNINFDHSTSDRVVLVDAVGNELAAEYVTGSKNELTPTKALLPGVYLLRYISADYQQVIRVFVKE